MTRAIPIILATCAAAAAVAGCGDSASGPSTTPETHALGTPAPFVLVPESGDGPSTNLTVNVLRITKGASADLDDFDLGSDRGSTPYYVRARFTNNDTVPLGRWEFPTPLVARLSDDTTAKRILISGEFPLCPAPTATSLAPGKTMTGCGVYIAPRGTRVVAVRGYSRGTTLHTWAVH